MTIVKIKKHKGANILILNDWHKFIYIIFYRGQFYANTFDIEKQGEYTDKEYLQALDGLLLAAKKTSNLIIQRSSIINKLKTYVKSITLQVFGIKRRDQEESKTS